jgi:hypothetical protein
MPVVGKLAVVLDVAVRCGVIIVTWVLIREFWAEEPVESNADGLPVRQLVAPIGAYLFWNVWAIARSIRVWAAGSIADTSFLALLGTLSLARLLWLRPLADELWDRHRDRGMTLFIASVACAALALGEALRGSMFRAPVGNRVDEGSRTE